MKDNAICGKCEKEAKFDKTCYVCDSCKRIVFSGCKTHSECISEVKKYIEAIERKLLENKFELHEIEQKVLNGYELTKGECIKKKFCTSWINLISEVKQFVLTDENRFSERSKNILYMLLQLSKKEF